MNTDTSDPVAGLRDKVSAVEAHAAELVSGLDDQSFSWAPEPGRWSIGQCLEHLNLTAHVFLPLFDRAIDGGVPATQPAAELRRGLLGGGFARILEPPVKGRVGAPKSVRPAPELSRDEVMERFAEAHTALVSRIESARAVDLNRTRMRHPAIPVIRFGLGAIFEIVLAHERRHLWQAEQVKKLHS